MVIVDKPNLERIKRALQAYETACCARALKSNDKAVEDYYDPEIKATRELMAIVDQNIAKIERSE